MRRTSLAKRNALLSRQTLSPGLLATVFALLALLLRLTAPDAFYAAVAPMARLGDTLTSGSRTLVASFGDTARLAKRNEELEEQNRALLGANLGLTERLAALDSLVGAPESGMAAGVLMRPPQSPYDTLIVAAGREEGVVPGMEVFGQGGVPLGIVTLVARRSAQVTLFSAPGVTTGGWIGPKKLPLTLVGEGGGVLAAYLAKAADIAEGDVVYLPGPGALPAGRVARVDSDPSFSQVRLQIVPATNPFSLTWVVIRDIGTVDFRSATAPPL